MTADRLTHDSVSCPYCGADFCYRQIPVEDRHMFGGQKWFLRSVSVASRELDRAVAVRCPDCGREDQV